MNITPGYYISLSHERIWSTAMDVHLGASLILHCIAFYCLVRKTPDYMLSVRTYLLQIQVSV
ncbi:hypothetical protein PRIPAC_87303 [Pristionchus pacificus]|uniref:G protein-coupled receptor n=1 Tax=Pristionchus pacificus TaxID=54126 RepID=A0A2A6CX69_PRIPA|nr:hypothetical protein PRIPAC_87303 [Pristionchus pacificus]|eukprot:PDM82759.1 G protein-coupled receptor [Pristionchus pacificus]